MIKAKFKGGTYLRNKDWRGVTLVDDGDHFKKCELLKEIPLLQGAFTGGFAVTTEVEWGKYIDDDIKRLMITVPFFNYEKWGEVDKAHLKKVFKAYCSLRNLMSENDEVCVLLFSLNVTLLDKFIEFLPDKFETGNKVPFSEDWFVELYDLIPCSKRRNELKELFIYIGLNLDNIEDDSFDALSGWIWFQKDLIGISEILKSVSVTPQVLKKNAITNGIVLIVNNKVSISDCYLRAVLSDLVSETIKLIQLHNSDYEFKNPRIVKEYYPVCIDLPFIDDLGRWGDIAGNALSSNMGVFLVTNNAEQLTARKNSKRLLLCTSRFFDTVFSSEKGVYGFSVLKKRFGAGNIDYGSDYLLKTLRSKLKKVFIK